jgi:hypothetical protein
VPGVALEETGSGEVTVTATINLASDAVRRFFRIRAEMVP